MKFKLVVVNSDQPNRYGSRFSVSGLFHAVEQRWRLGSPSFVSHDYHRPIAWSKPLGVYIEPSQVRLVGTSHFPEDAEESEQISQAVNGFFNSEAQGHLNDHRSSYDRLIAPHLQSDYRAASVNCVAAHEPGILESVLPDILSNKDKDGLIPYMELEEIVPGVFRVGEYAVFAHPFFRRSLSRINSMNTPFFEELRRVAQSVHVNPRIALDEETIGIAESVRTLIELEYWWGPKFTDDIKAMPSGVTHHEADESLRIFHGVSGTQFWWYGSADGRSFECEEIRDLPSLGIGQDDYGCRFSHMMLDAESSIVHFDGAVRHYTSDQMTDRIDNDISKSGKNTRYKKLWRIDGQVAVRDWKALLSHYFRDNTLVGEYLGAKRTDDAVRRVAIDSTVYSTPLEEYVPTEMTEGMGVRIAVSLRETPKSFRKGITMVSHDTVTIDGQPLRYIEHDTIDLVKLMRKSGYAPRLPKDTVYMAFEDMAVNLPLLVHSGLDAVTQCHKTHEHLGKLVRSMIERYPDRLLSYNLGISFRDTTICVSVAGHIQDMQEWLAANVSRPPRSLEGVSKWCEDAASYLRAKFAARPNSPKLDDILHETGILLFERRFLDSDSYNLRVDEDSHSIEAQLLIKKNDKKLLGAIGSGQLTTSSLHLVRKARCSSCSRNYEKCDCSKYANENTYLVMEDAPFVGLFWTNRTAFDGCARPKTTNTRQTSRPVRQKHSKKKSRGKRRRKR